MTPYAEPTPAPRRPSPEGLGARWLAEYKRRNLDAARVDSNRNPAPVTPNK